MNRRVKNFIGIVAVLIILIGGIGGYAYRRAHTFTLSGDEQIQPVTGTVTVSSPRDTEVIFIDVKSGDNFAIPYITSGTSETIRLEKGNWYRIETGEGLTLHLVNVRIE